MDLEVTLDLKRVVGAIIGVDWEDKGEGWRDHESRLSGVPGTTAAGDGGRAQEIPEDRVPLDHLEW